MSVHVEIGLLLAPTSMEVSCRKPSVRDISGSRCWRHNIRVRYRVQLVESHSAAEIEAIEKSVRPLGYAGN
jgi:hypothetical protein